MCHCCYFVDCTASVVDWRVLRVVERVCSQLYVAVGSALLRWMHDDELLSHVSYVTSNYFTLYYIESLLTSVGLYYITYCVLRVHSHLDLLGVNYCMNFSAHTIMKNGYITHC